MLDQFAELLTTATPEEQRALVREVFDRVWIEPHAIKAQRPAEMIQLVVATIANSMVGNMGCPMGFEPTTP